MGIGKVIALDDLLDNARRRAIRLELSVMLEESSLTDRANIELLSNQLEAALAEGGVQPVVVQVCRKSAASTSGCLRNGRTGNPLRMHSEPSSKQALQAEQIKHSSFSRLNLLNRKTGESI